MNKTVGSVIDDISESVHPQYGTTYYVTCMFTDDTVGSAGKKKYEHALELQGLLQEAIGIEQEFTLESQGKTKTGRDKFKILGFGTPGGAATYTAPGVQGGGSPAYGPTGSGARARPPEHDVDASIRASVALKAAVNYCAPQHKVLALDDVFLVAENFDAWLAKKASEPALSAYDSGGLGTVTPASSTTPAGAGSEPSAAELAADSGEGQVGGGEAQACPPHDLDLDVAPKAMRYPCRRCGAWVKPTMAAEEAEEAAK